MNEIGQLIAKGEKIKGWILKIKVLIQTAQTGAKATETSYIDQGRQERKQQASRRNLNIRLPHRRVQEGSQTVKPDLSMLHAGSNKDPAFAIQQPTQTRALASLGEGVAWPFPRTSDIWAFRALAHTLCVVSCLMADHLQGQALGSLKAYWGRVESLMSKMSTELASGGLAHKYPLKSNTDMHRTVNNKYIPEIYLLLGQKALWMSSDTMMQVTMKCTPQESTAVSSKETKKKNHVKHKTHIPLGTEV